MFAAEVRWKLDEYMLMLRITGITQLTPIGFLNEELQRQLIGNMASILDCAEGFEGKPMDMRPVIPQEADTLIVVSTIIFNSHNNMDAFKRELPNVLNQG